MSVETCGLRESGGNTPSDPDRPQSFNVPSRPVWVDPRTRPHSFHGQTCGKPTDSGMAITATAFDSFCSEPKPKPVDEPASTEDDDACMRVESRNLFCLSLFYAVYLGFRWGTFIVLPLASKLLLQDVLHNADFSTWYQLPLTIWFVMDVLVATPNAFFMRRYGRPAGFTLGASCALIACIIATCSLSFISQPWICFIMLNVSAAIMSILGMAVFVRYAAAEACTNDARRGVIVSRVLGFAALAASAGPLSTGLASWLAKDEGLKQGYAFFFMFSGGFALIGLLASLAMKLPPIAMPLTVASDVPLIHILRRPWVTLAIFSQTAFQFTMTTLMFGSPLAMDSDSNASGKFAPLLISLCMVGHTNGMFLPGFFSGNLTAKVGKVPMIGAGIVIQGMASVIFLIGTSVGHFSVGLAMLGVGWNFAFVSSTLLLLDSHTLEERTRVSSVNETLRFAANALAALISSSFSWTILNWICLSILSISVLICPLLYARTRFAVSDGEE